MPWVDDCLELKQNPILPPRSLFVVIADALDRHEATAVASVGGHHRGLGRGPWHFTSWQSLERDKPSTGGWECDYWLCCWKRDIFIYLIISFLSFRFCFVGCFCIHWEILETLLWCENCPLWRWGQMIPIFLLYSIGSFTSPYSSTPHKELEGGSVYFVYNHLFWLFQMCWVSSGFLQAFLNIFWGWNICRCSDVIV